MKPPANCSIALGEKDETIDPKVSAEHFVRAHIRFYNDDHSMIKSFARVLDEFEEFLDEKF
jgi:hypothetical protein